MSKVIVKLGEICEIKGGKRLPKGSDFSETGYPYIRARDIKNGRVTFDSPVFINDELRSRLQRYKVKANDICVTIVGINVGDTGIVPASLDDANLTENAAKLTNLNGILPHYLNYYLLVDGIKEQLKAYSTGSAQDKLALYKLGKLDVILPSISNQQKIAGILSAYDELIENNKKRIALLEAMAEELYKEWFVRFRFPNYENTEFEKGVPSNWEETTLKYIANVTMGQSPSSEFYNDAGVGLPFHQGVGTYGERFPINSTFCSIEGRLAQENDILFSVRAPVGRLNIATTQSIIGRGLCAINSKNGQSDYLFYLLNHTFSKEDIIGNGAIFNSVSKDELLGFKLINPDEKIIEDFNLQAKSINEAIRILFDKNANLTTQKNKLLPRLISGKLSVENLDIQQPPTLATNQPTEPNTQG